MSEHLPSWLDFANERLGIGLEDKDIIFVSGFTKTTVWAEAAFNNTNNTSEIIVAGGCFVPSVSGDFRVSISRGLDASVISRVGPPGRIAPREDDADEDYKYDQCIFLNYFKMKKRGLLRRPTVMRAAAGPHELPDNDDDSGSTNCPNVLAASSSSLDSDDIGQVSSS